MVDDSSKIGEVVEANTTGFCSECYELHRAPAFGSFVVARDGAGEAYGIVSNIQTTSLDPGGGLCRGRDELDPEDVYRNNPELPELLRTQFETVIIGFGEDEQALAPFARYLAPGQVRSFLPPLPPRLHAFVYPCPMDIVQKLTADMSFLQTVLATAFRAGSDDLVAAAIRHASAGQPWAYRVAAGKELARLLMNDPQRLNSLLRRLAK